MLIEGYDTQERMLVFFVGRYARAQNSREYDSGQNRSIMR